MYLSLLKKKCDEYTIIINNDSTKAVITFFGRFYLNPECIFFLNFLQSYAF